VSDDMLWVSRPRDEVLAEVVRRGTRRRRVRHLLFALGGATITVVVVASAFSLVGAPRPAQRNDVAAAIATPRQTKGGASIEEPLVLVGRVVSKQIRNVKDHPDLVFSSDPAEAKQQRESSTHNRYRAEFVVDVTEWIDGSGPRQVTIAQGVAYVDDAAITTSTDWTTPDPFLSVEEGLSYRFIVAHDPWFQRDYYLLWNPSGSILPADQSG
jgi:hypothetical protein